VEEEKSHLQAEVTSERALKRRVYEIVESHAFVGEYLSQRSPEWQVKLKSKDLWNANTMRETSDCINEFIYPELEYGQGWPAARVRLNAAIKRLGLTDE
jgi:hypothetical protein